MPLNRARFKISEYSSQVKKNSRKRDRAVKQVSLSLTSMVDMFAILVIFLLTNAGDSQQWIELVPGLDLPKSKLSEKIEQGASIQIAQGKVTLDNKPIATLAEVEKGFVHVGIRDALRNIASKDTGTAATPAAKDAKAPAAPAKENKLTFINVAADRSVPFGAIRRIIATCKEAGFGNVNLAVQPK